MNKDYIVRLIEQASVLTYRVLFFKKNNNIEESIRELNTILEKRIGLDISKLELMTQEEIIEALNLCNPIILDDNLILVAELLDIKGDIDSGEEKDAEAYNCHIKALGLYLHIFTMALESSNDDYDYKVDEILEKVSEYHIPVETERMLFYYRYKRGQYAEAENILFSILDELEESNQERKVFNEIIKIGLEFYNNLLEISPEKLEEGDFSMDDVHKGIEDLNKIKNI